MHPLEPSECFAFHVEGGDAKSLILSSLMEVKNWLILKNQLKASLLLKRGISSLIMVVENGRGVRWCLGPIAAKPSGRMREHIWPSSVVRLVRSCWKVCWFERIWLRAVRRSLLSLWEEEDILMKAPNVRRRNLYHKQVQETVARRMTMLTITLTFISFQIACLHSFEELTK